LSARSFFARRYWGGCHHCPSSIRMIDADPNDRDFPSCQYGRSPERFQTMSSSVTLSAAVRSNLLALQDTTNLQATTQQRLATGKKVNSALDNPANFFTAAALSARAGELTNLLDSMTNGINTLKAADNGLTSITTTIQSMQASVTQARQDASWQSGTYTVDASTIGTSTTKQLSFSGGALSG